jgi:hypothetical protein
MGLRVCCIRRGAWSLLVETDDQALPVHQVGVAPLLFLAARRHVRIASQNENSCASSGTEGLHSMKARRVKAWAGRILPTIVPLETMSKARVKAECALMVSCTSPMQNFEGAK